MERNICVICYDTEKYFFFYFFSLKWTIMPIVVRYSSEWKISHSFYESWINVSSIFEINHSVEKKHRVHQEGRDYLTLRCWEPSVRFLSIHDTLILFSSAENLPSFTFFFFLPLIYSHYSSSLSFNNGIDRFIINHAILEE